LLRADATKIIRHTKIRKKQTHMTRNGNLYFEEREGDRMFESMNGRKRLKEMWKKQRGKCLVFVGMKLIKKAVGKYTLAKVARKNLYIRTVIRDSFRIARMLYRLKCNSRET
jgi:RNA-directed DNA polymerase